MSWMEVRVSDRSNWSPVVASWRWRRCRGGCWLRSRHAPRDLLGGSPRGEALWRGPARLGRQAGAGLRLQPPKTLRECDAIRTRGPGYALELKSGVSLDALRFERLLAESREAASAANLLLAASLLRRALSLWRGAAFGDFAYEEFARTEAERLEELRVVCLEERIEAELTLGHHRELLAEALALAASHPLRERSRRTRSWRSIAADASRALELYGAGCVFATSSD